MENRFRYRFNWLFGNPGMRFFVDDNPAGGDDDPGGGGGGGPAVVETPDWLNEPQYAETIADEKNRTMLSRYETEDAAVKAGLKHKILLDSDFRMPEKLNDEQITELTSRMALHNKVPENAEGYKLVRPEKFDEKLDMSESAKMNLRAFAKEKGWSPETLQGAYEMAINLNSESLIAATKKSDESKELERESTVNHLEKYWGPEEYKALTTKGKDGFSRIEKYFMGKAIDDTEYATLKGLLDNTGLKNNRLLFKAMGDATLNYEKLYGDGKIEPGGFEPGKVNAALASQEASAKRNPNTPARLGGGGTG